MANIREDVIKMLNQCLELEHSARIQYLAHAELIKGPGAEKIIERIKEISSDEEKHEGIFRKLIGNFLDGEPSMNMAPAHKAQGMEKIIAINLQNEKEAIDFYKQVYKKILDNKESFQYSFETLEHDIRHVIIDEQEHVTELSLLLGK